MILQLTRPLFLHRYTAYRTSIFTGKFRTMADSYVTKLGSPLSDLVQGATSEFGKSDKDKIEVAEWIEKVAQGDIVKPAGVKVRICALTMPIL